MGVAQGIGNVAAAGISTAGQAAVSAATNATNWKIANDLNKTNIQIADTNNANAIELQNKQNEWNQEQWNRENEYNSPAAQMQRYAAAGINPVFGPDGGGVQPGNAAQLESAAPPVLQQPTLNMPQMAVPEIADSLNKVMGAFANWAKTKSEIGKNDKEGMKIDQEVFRMQQMTPIEVANAMKSGILMDESIKLTIAQTKNEEQKKEQIAAITDATREQINKMKMESIKMLNDINVSLKQLDIAQQDLAIAGYNAVTNRQQAQTAARAQNLAEKKYKEIEKPEAFSRIALNKANTALTRIEEQLKKKELGGVVLGKLGGINLEGLTTQIGELVKAVGALPVQAVDLLDQTGAGIERGIGEFFTRLYQDIQYIMGMSNE